MDGDGDGSGSSGRQHGMACVCIMVRRGGRTMRIIIDSYGMIISKLWYRVAWVNSVHHELVEVIYNLPIVGHYLNHIYYSHLHICRKS
jgi:hypothetical protein